MNIACSYNGIYFLRKVFLTVFIIFYALWGVVLETFQRNLPNLPHITYG